MNNTPTPSQSVVFGDFIRTHRVSKGILARDAAIAAGILPSNLSKIEHGINTPPRDTEKLKQLADAMGFRDEGADKERFFDLAAAATDSVPADIASILSRDNAMPLLLRTIGNKRLTKAQVERLIEIIQKS
jgi:transcriptional regulator with XRE-family HTH domain